MQSKAMVLTAGVLMGAAAVTLGNDRPRQIDLSEVPMPDRIERSCGPPSERTAIIVIHGQSNAANYGSSRYVARHAVDNFDPATGKCLPRPIRYWAPTASAAILGRPSAIS